MKDSECRLLIEFQMSPVCQTTTSTLRNHVLIQLHLYRLSAKHVRRVCMSATFSRLTVGVLRLLKIGLEGNNKMNTRTSFEEHRRRAAVSSETKFKATVGDDHTRTSSSLCSNRSHSKVFDWNLLASPTFIVITLSGVLVYVGKLFGDCYCRY